jgi:hypothetical protein
VGRPFGVAAEHGADGDCGHGTIPFCPPAAKPAPAKLVPNATNCYPQLTNR